MMSNHVGFLFFFGARSMRPKISLIFLLTSATGKFINFVLFLYSLQDTRLSFIKHDPVSSPSQGKFTPFITPHIRLLVPPNLNSVFLSLCNVTSFAASSEYLKKKKFFLRISLFLIIVFNIVVFINNILKDIPNLPAMQSAKEIEYLSNFTLFYSLVLLLQKKLFGDFRMAILDYGHLTSGSLASSTWRTQQL